MPSLASSLYPVDATDVKPEADEGVRARMVVKDIARGAATARAQGISSPTPSVESLRVLLGMACGAWGCPPCHGLVCQRS